MFKQMVTKSSFITDSKNEQLVLAHQNLTHFPPDLSADYDRVTVLDLSCNQISDASFLLRFKNLQILILDHNLINSNTVFPKLPKLKTLWLNHNEIYQIAPFILSLSRKCRNLEVLSLMDNKGVASFKNSNHLRHILFYRYFVISKFPNLFYLDEGSVTSAQKSEAYKLFGEPTFSVFLKTTYTKLTEFLSLKNRDNTIV